MQNAATLKVARFATLVGQASYRTMVDPSVVNRRISIDCRYTRRSEWYRVVKLGRQIRFRNSPDP